MTQDELDSLLQQLTDQSESIEAIDRMLSTAAAIDVESLSPQQLLESIQSVVLAERLSLECWRQTLLVKAIALLTSLFPGVGKLREIEVHTDLGSQGQNR